MQEKIGKVLTVILWAAIVYHWLIGIQGSLGVGLHYAGLGLLVAHAIECGVFYRKIGATDRIPYHLLMTFIFGYFHANFIKSPGK